VETKKKAFGKRRKRMRGRGSMKHTNGAILCKINCLPNINCRLASSRLNELANRNSVYLHGRVTFSDLCQYHRWIFWGLENPLESQVARKLFEVYAPIDPPRDF